MVVFTRNSTLGGAPGPSDDLFDPYASLGALELKRASSVDLFGLAAAPDHR